MRRRFRPRQRRPDGPPVNDGIRERRVLVVDETGRKLGEFLTPDAVHLARDRGLDLILVAPEAKPPVARVGDWGRMKYERSKRAREAKANAKNSTLKELKVRPKTDDHDLAVKIKRARRFLKRGDRVKISVWFRGREHAHHEIGTRQCQRIAQAVDEIAKVEAPPHMEGRRMHMILAPDA